MALSAPYYTVGKQRAQWHKNKAEYHLGKAGGFALTSATSGYLGWKGSGYALQAGASPVVFRVAAVASGAAAGGHTIAGAYHAEKAAKIKKDLKAYHSKQKNVYAKTDEQFAAGAGSAVA